MIILVSLALFITGGEVSAQETHPPGNMIHFQKLEAAKDPLQSILGFSYMGSRRDLPVTPAMAEHHLQMMREHLESIQKVTAALAEKNFDQALLAAQSLVSSSSTTAQCNAMGSAAPGFSAMGLKLHSQADLMIVSIKNRNLIPALKQLGSTLQTCTSCHASYRHKIVTEEQFRNLNK